MDYASMFGGGGGGGGGGGDKATAAAATSTSGNQFGGIGAADGGVNGTVLIIASGIFVLGLAFLAWVITRK